MPLTTVLALVYIMTLILVMYLIKKIIYVAQKKHLFDEPGEERKIHQAKVPNLGGIAIFGSMLLICTFFVPPNSLPDINIIFPAALMLFALGLIDDLVGMDPLKKFTAQICAAVMVSSLSQYRVESFYGLFGQHSLPGIFRIIFTSLFLILTINAINLCDGINGLAGCLTLLSSLFFSYVFYQSGSYGFLTLSVALCAGMTGFLFFNFTPAKIFMGDTGAIFIGFLLGVFSLHYLHLKPLHGKSVLIDPAFAPVYICAILLVPFFDTIRVFTVRMLQKRSPFIADRTHVHHRLIDLNLSHEKAVIVLLGVTIGGLILSAVLQPAGLFVALGSLSIYVVILDRLLIALSQRRWNRLIRAGQLPAIFQFSRNKTARRGKSIKRQTYTIPEISN